MSRQVELVNLEEDHVAQNSPPSSESSTQSSSVFGRRSPDLRVLLDKRRDATKARHVVIDSNTHPNVFERLGEIQLTSQEDFCF